MESQKSYLNKLEIYTDGSHYGDKGIGKGERYVGFGVWCEYKNEEHEVSQECTLDIIQNFGLTEQDLDIISNPTAEFLALAYTFWSLNFILSSTTSYTITIYSDYEGVQKWISGAWKAKKTYIKKIKSYCDKWIKDHPTVELKLVWLKGHDGNIGNNKADALAKSKINKNTLITLKF